MVVCVQVDKEARLCARDMVMKNRSKFVFVFALLAAVSCTQTGAEKTKTAAEQAISIAEASGVGDAAWLEARALANKAAEAPEWDVRMAGIIGRSFVLGPDSDARVAEAEPLLIKGLAEDNRLHWLLAKGYENGWYGEADKALACDHYRAASEEAHLSRSYWPTALCYLNGDGVEKDATLAFDWMSKSADFGDQNGMVSLAVLYATGQGVEKDLNMAATWYETAIRTKGPNRAQAMRGLGAMHMFELEDGIKQRGYALLELAVEEGDRVAGQLLGRVEQLDETQRNAVDVQKSFLINFLALEEDSTTEG